MKQTLLPFLFILTSWQASAGDTTRIYYNKAWEQSGRDDASYYRKYWRDSQYWIVRDYFISGQLQMSGSYSDDSLATKDGQFWYYHENGKLSKSATYRHGKEEGIVKDWFEDGRIQYEGMYKNGKVEGPTKTWYPGGRLADSSNLRNGELEGYGIWYYENGQKSEEGIYKKGKPFSVRFWTEAGSPDPKGVGGEVMPKFNSATGNELSDYLANTLQYPEKTRDKGQEGRAVVEFTVTKTGRVTNVKVNKSSGVSELDKEALRVVSNMPDWKPGIAHNRKVDVFYTLPVSFKLD